MMTTRDRGVAAATLCLAAIGLMGAQLLYGMAFFLPDGYWALMIAPVAGIAMGTAVFFALRRVCTRGSRLAESVALATIVLMAAASFFGISFGGLVLAPAALMLMVAHVLTPHPDR